MTSLKLGCLNLKLHLHIGILAHNMYGEGLIPCPRPPPPTFTFNDCITHKHQQHALNAFVLDLDLVKSRGSCNNNNTNNNKNNNNNNQPPMAWPGLNDLIDAALNDPDIALNHNMPN